MGVLCGCDYLLYPVVNMTDCYNVQDAAGPAERVFFILTNPMAGYIIILAYFGINTDFGPVI